MAGRHPRTSKRSISAAFDPILPTRPADIPATAYDQFQAQPRFSNEIDRIFGYVTDMSCDFISKDNWSDSFSSLNNIIFARGVDPRRSVISIPTCLNARGSGYESENFANVVVGTGVWTSVLDGGLDPYWLRMSSAGRQRYLKDAIWRVDWEHTASYFPWYPGKPVVADTMEACRQSRLARRYIVDRMKCPTYDPNGKGVNPDAVNGNTIGHKFFFNPECGGNMNVPAEQTWPGTVRFAGSGASAAAPPSGGAGMASIGLMNDWYTWRDTRTNPNTVTVYKKVGTTDQNAVWTVQAGLTEPVIPFPDGVSPYKDANGNSYKYVDYLGSEAYAANYDMFNNTPELLFQNRTLGIVEEDLSWGPFNIKAGFREHAIKEGVGYWLQFALKRGVDPAQGEWGAGMKIDFPQGVSMQVSGMGSIYDNPHHIRWMAAGFRQYGIKFHIIWNHNVSDFKAAFTETPRLTGLPPDDPTKTKELQGAEVVRQFGKPGRYIRPYDESNVACGAITITWLSGFANGVIPANTPLGTAVATVTEGANAKRVNWCTYGNQDGVDGTGYGPLAFRDGLNPDGTPDNVLRYRSQQSVGTQKLWIQASNEVGPFSQLRRDITVT